jgi:hypothetical protein
MSGRVVVASAVALLAAQTARAQDIRAMCEKVLHPPVGSWSEFRTAKGSEAGRTMRFAVVGRETHGDTAYLWLEFAARGFGMGEGRGGLDTVTVISKMLAPGFGAGMEAARTYIMKFGNLPAMEMPVNNRGTNPGASMLEDCQRSQVVGWEQVTVPAGTFRALHVRDSEGHGDTWVDPDLPFGVVKGGGADDSDSVELVAHGTGARSQITETPRPFDARLFMQMLQGGRSRP